MASPEQNGSPELFLKPGAFVRLTSDGVEKRMGPAEAEAYAVLDYYRDQLHDDAVSVVVPRLVEYDEGAQMGVLTNIGDFRHFSCTEYFGRSDTYVPSYYAAIHGVARVLRAVIPSSSVPNGRDYEVAQPGSVPAMGYLRSGLTGNEPAEVGGLLEAVAAINTETQADIAPLPLLAGHLDPNPNNFLVTEQNGSQTVAVVDWETFGVSRTGYDEGRLMSYLALADDKQQEYGDFARGVFGRNELVYFWRVAVNRGVREYISFSNGHYDSRLAVGNDEPNAVDRVRRSIMNGLSRVVFRGVAELESLGVRL